MVGAMTRDSHPQGPSIVQDQENGHFEPNVLSRVASQYCYVSNVSNLRAVKEGKLTAAKSLQGRKDVRRPR